MARKNRRKSQEDSDKTRPEDELISKTDPADFQNIGPVSIRGVEARDLPDNRGSIETGRGKEAKRTLPQHDGAIEGDGGLRAAMDVGDAKVHGHRKHN